MQDDELLRYLSRLQQELAEPRELMQGIGDLLVQRIESRTADKLDPDGAPWAPLAESTLRRKRGQGSILVGAQHRRGGRELLGGHMLEHASANADDTSVEVGFPEPYAGYHETGTSRMPRRGLLTSNWQTGELGAGDRQAVLDLVYRFLDAIG